MKRQGSNRALSAYHLVAVLWDDAHHSIEEFSKEDIERDFHQVAKEINYGLLIKNDEVGVTLAFEEDSGGDFRHVFFIPRQMIREVIDFGIPKRPRKARAPKEKTGDEA